MSEQIPEHRPSAVVAAWESQKAHARPHLVKPTGSMHRSNEMPTPGKDGPQVDNGVSLCKHAWRQIVKGGACDSPDRRETCQVEAGLYELSVGPKRLIHAT